ncbi:hypothetical protein [Sphingobacterium yanglingense]|uniref:Uncharacterized protein n=1 Tax=Sphingobacterium yanglingense TaxID=1437280 RepID=A0A4R6W4X3_9SPHI|nr:hypothetical protein [Sphingobacterium yanglingense]TDQ73774.1 hypothetical protein CLV99_4211 [Sphingobacterium yanglingense]
MAEKTNTLLKITIYGETASEQKRVYVIDNKSLKIDLANLSPIGEQRHHTTIQNYGAKSSNLFPIVPE